MTNQGTARLRATAPTALVDAVRFRAAHTRPGRNKGMPPSRSMTYKVLYGTDTAKYISEAHAEIRREWGLD